MIKKNRIDKLDFLRGISIIAVLLFHFDLLNFKYGYLGVDIFFLVSGFILTKIYFDSKYEVFYDREKKSYEQLNKNKNMNLKNVDFIFIDGGHDYKTVKNDLEQSFKIINKNGTILCDDWNLSQALGVREAIKDFSKEQNINFEIVHERFAQFNL